MYVRTVTANEYEETIHGVRVTDPYRWLEDRTSIETRDWIKEQRLRYDAYFANTAEVEYLRAQVHSYLNVDRIDQPVRVADRLFYRRRKKDQEQGSIYLKFSNSGQERLLVDA